MQKKAVAHNTISQVLGKLFSIIVNVVIVYLLAHHFSRNDVGEYTAVFSFLLFFNVLADLGLSTILVRDIHHYTEENQPRFIGNVIMIRTISLILSLGIGVGIGFLIPAYNDAVKIGILVASGSSFFLLMATLLYAVFQNHLRMQDSVYANALGLLANLLLVILFLKEHLSINWAIFAVTIGYGVILVVTVFLVWRQQKISFKFDKLIWKTILPQSATIGGMIVFSSIYYRADSVILSIMKPFSVLSLYTVPYKIVDVFIAFPQMFMAPVFALMSREIADNNMDRFKHMFQRAVDFLIIAALPIIPGAYFLSEKAILLYAGTNYRPSGSVLEILSLAIFISFLGSAFIFVVLLFKRQYYLLFWNIFLSVFNIILNIMLIPHFSYYASAWITVATEALVFCGSVYFVHRSIDYTPSFSLIMKGLVSVIPFTIVLWLLAPFNLFLQAFVACVVYGICLILTRTITLQEIQEIIHSE